MAPLKPLTHGSAKVKASRLRRKGALTPEQSSWLQSYEATRRAKAKAKPQPPIEMRSQPATSSTVQNGTAPAPALSTEPPKANYANETWVPVAPAAADAPEGAKGAPIVEEKPDTAAQALAAQKIGGALALLTMAGLTAAKELAVAGKFPVGVANEMMAGFDDKTLGEFVLYVRGAGERVALKYGVSVAWQYEDEALVALAIAGSAFAIVQARAVRALAEPPAAAPVQNRTQAAAVAAPAPVPEKTDWPQARSASLMRDLGCE